LGANEAYELLERGRELLAHRRDHQAALVLQKARDLEPSKGSIREALARAFYNTGRTQDAESEFEKALEMDPADHYAYFGLALCRARLGDTARAAGLLKIALAMRPEIEDYRRALSRLAG
jgi:Tfp pilus assembly protein PilF